MSEGSNNGGKVVLIIFIVVFVLGGLAGAFYWFKYKPEQEAKEKARLEQIAKAEAEKKARELAEQNKVKYEKLITDADAAFEAGDWRTAQSLYSQASSTLPDQQYASSQLAIVNDKVYELDAQEARRAAGIVETISSATGRYYVIVSSSLDDDLAMDYAKKLAYEGQNVKIVEHSAEKLSFFGVSVADYDTRLDAENATGAYSGLSGSAWVLSK